MKTIAIAVMTASMLTASPSWSGYADTCKSQIIMIEMSASLFHTHNKWRQQGKPYDEYIMKKHRFRARQYIQEARKKGCVIPPLPPGL